MANDIKSVMDDLERCTHPASFTSCHECTHKGTPDDCPKCFERLAADALEVLKEQKELIEQYKSACQTCKSRLDGVKPF